MRESIMKLHEGEEGERFNLKRSYEWILNEMSYKDFRAFATLRFVDTGDGYNFSYKYMVTEEHDTPSAREDYLKYMMYKLVQNIETPAVELQGVEK